MSLPHWIQAATHARHSIDQSGTSLDTALHQARYLWARDMFCQPGMDVLDLGCGTGFGVALLAEVAGNVVGVDFSDEGLAMAADRYARDNGRYVKADLTSTELVAAVGREQFDLVTSMETIEHLEDYFTFVASAAQVLRPGGIFVVGTPNRRMTYEQFPNRQHMDPSHVQEFTCVALRHTLGEQFGSVDLYLQSVPRYWAMKEQAAGSAPSTRSSFVRQWVPPRAVPAVRRAQSWLRPSGEVAPPAWSIDDVEITEASASPDREGEAFSILAVCRAPRR
jgi:SAM-dependent methyltransferase